MRRFKAVVTGYDNKKYDSVNRKLFNAQDRVVDELERWGSKTHRFGILVNDPTEGNPVEYFYLRPDDVRYVNFVEVEDG